MPTAATKLEISWPNLCDAAKTKIEEFLDSGLRHHYVKTQELHANPDLSQWAIEVYESIVGFISDGDDLKLHTTLNVAREKFEEGCRAFGAVLGSEERKLHELNSQLNEARSINNQLAQELAAKKVDLEIAKDSVEKLNALGTANGVIENELRQAKAENNQLSQELNLTKVDLEIAKGSAEKVKALELASGLIEHELRQVKAKNDELAQELNLTKVDLEIANGSAEKLTALALASGLVEDELRQVKAENDELAQDLNLTKVDLEIAKGRADKLKALELASGLIEDEVRQVKAENEKLKVLNEYSNIEIERFKNVLSRYEAVLERARVDSSKAADLVVHQRELEIRNAALVASTSWRVTRPLRWMGTWRKRQRYTPQRPL